jgi:peroxiredoxin
MKIEKGMQAPEFSLLDSDKNKITLSELKGKNVVLLFFPFAFSGTCTKELCATRDGISFYNDMNAQVYGISIDSYFVLAKFKEDQKLNFPLLSDFNKEVSQKYDAFYDEFLGMKGVARRAAFVIDKNGIVQYAEVLEKAGDLPDFNAIQETLKGLN